MNSYLHACKVMMWNAACRDYDVMSLEPANENRRPSEVVGLWFGEGERECVGRVMQPARVV